MPLRKLLIRVMLLSLGATAVAGALAALMGGGAVGGRIVGTGFFATVAAGLMLPFSFLADKEKSRREGLLGMLLVVVEFSASLGLLWEIFDALGGYRLDEEIGLTMLFLALTGLPAILFLRFTSMQTPRNAGRVGIGLSGAVFAILMIATWNGTHEDQWYETASAMALLGTLGVASLAGKRNWRWAGVAAAGVALAMAIVGIWQHLESGHVTFAAIVSIAAVIAHANLCMLVPLTAGQKWVRVVTILAAIATALLCDLLIAAEQFDSDAAFINNLAAATGIILSCGSLALLVMARINRHLDRVPVLSEIKEMTIICPACQKKQTLSIGESKCGNCGLKISLRVEEPHCPQCDYVLLMLHSDRCPECGTLINAAG